MTDAQEKLVELLSELDAICRQEHIPYFLYTKWYRAAVRSQGFENEAPDLSIMIFAEDAQRFIDAVSDRMGDSRYLEYMGNSEVFYRVCLAYGRKDTLDLGTLGFGTTKHHGLHVNVELLRPATSDQGDSLKEFVETGWEAFCRPEVYSPKRQHALDCVVRLVDRYGRSNVASWIFDLLVLRDSDVEAMRRVKIYQKPRYNEYPPEWFEQEGAICFEGVETPLMYGSEEYLKKHFGERWKTTPDKTSAPNPMSRIVDPHVPYAAYFARLKKDGVDARAIWDARLAFEKENAHVRYLREKRDKYWDLLFACGDRYSLHQQLMPKKDSALALREKGDVKALSKLLSDYCAKAVEHVKKGNGLYFDQELFECLCYVLENTGESALAKKIGDCVPEAHKKPIEYVNYLGEPLTSFDETMLSRDERGGSCGEMH